MEVHDGLLTESVCKKPVHIKTEPIADNYTVEARPFARGKFATVRRCCQKVSGVEFAAKSMRKRRRASDVRDEILHEAHVLELSTRHPHIVQLHEVYETQSEITLVLELVPGGELQRVLDDEEVVPEIETTRLLRQILAGVSFLHDHNIAHLDLKPQNLLLTKPFPEGEVKLCDFGISRLISKGIEIREIVGTPDYVAPEVLHYEPISLATDMWSIGILTYVLLSGHSPFGGDTKQETFCNITQGALEFPPDLFGDVSNNAKDFIQRLLVRNPRNRMTAEECLSHPWLCTGDLQKNLIGIDLTLTSPDDTLPPAISKQDSTTPLDPASPLRVEKGNLNNTLNRGKINSVCESINGVHNPNLFSKSSTTKPKDRIDPQKGATFSHGSPSLKRSSLGDQKNVFHINNQNGTTHSIEHTNGNKFYSSPSKGICHLGKANGSMFFKDPLHNDTTGLMEHTNMFCKSPSHNGSSDLKEKSKGSMFCKSPLRNGPGELMEHANNNMFCKSPLQNGTGDLMEHANGTMFCKSLSQNSTSDQKEQSNDNVFCKNSSQSTSDLKENSASNKSVDVVVAQFEGISVSKRVVYSEEIILEERVGMVY